MSYRPTCRAEIIDRGEDFGDFEIREIAERTDEQRNLAGTCGEGRAIATLPSGSGRLYSGCLAARTPPLADRRDISPAARDPADVGLASSPGSFARETVGRDGPSVRPVAVTIVGEDWRVTSRYRLALLAGLPRPGRLLGRLPRRADRLFRAAPTWPALRRERWAPTASP